MKIEVKHIDINKIEYRPCGMSKERFQLLKKDISKNGIKMPLIIDKDTLRILDGIHRYAIAKELNIETLPIIMVNANKLSKESLNKLVEKLTKLFSTIQC